MTPRPLDFVPYYCSHNIDWVVIIARILINSRSSFFFFLPAFHGLHQPLFKPRCNPYLPQDNNNFHLIPTRLQKGPHRRGGNIDTTPPTTFSSDILVLVAVVVSDFLLIPLLDVGNTGIAAADMVPIASRNFTSRISILEAGCSVHLAKQICLNYSPVYSRNRTSKIALAPTGQGNTLTRVMLEFIGS